MAKNKWLITGISGFVGGHLVEEIFREEPAAMIFGVDIYTPRFEFLKEPYRNRIRFHKVSLLERNRAQNLLKKIKPDYIVNLASYSSVEYSWGNPLECYANNTNIFLNVIEAAQEAGLKPRILSIGSSEEYGRLKKHDIPVMEEHPLNPINPYAIARVSQEYIAKIYAKARKIPIVFTRSFNHIGPRQKEIFAVSSFAKQVVEAKHGKRRKIVCGDLDIIRDFTDVRDVVRAYYLLLKKGKPFEAYNVCSGEGHKLSAILEMLQKIAGTNVAIERSERLVRPKENPIMVGSPQKLEKDTGFTRKYPLSRSLEDILTDWENRTEL